MPYIKAERRPPLRMLAAALVAKCETPADLCYALTALAHWYTSTGKQDWDAKSNVHKALVCAEREYYLRVIKPHEDGAIARNGRIGILGGDA